MTYSDAFQWKEEHLGLVGTTDEKGFTISELIIVPTTSKAREAFFNIYLDSKDMEQAIKPYMSADMQVWSVDLQRLDAHNILFYKILAR